MLISRFKNELQTVAEKNGKIFSLYVVRVGLGNKGSV